MLRVESGDFLTHQMALMQQLAVDGGQFLEPYQEAATQRRHGAKGVTNLGQHS